MSDIISPNMRLPIPTVGDQPGPDYAENINASLTLVDQHDHSPGNGIRITPAGINISSDLTFASNNAIDLRSSRYTPQASALSLPTDLGAVYVSGADLYYNDTAGNQVRLTQGGSIVGTAGSITGLPSGTASASFAAGTFTWQSATSTSANMDFASAIFRNSSANSKGLTLSPPNAMPADYDLTLPSLPITTSIMTMDSSGNMAAEYTVDNSTIIVSAGVIGVPAGGIQASNLAAGAKGGMQFQVFTSSGNFTVPAGRNAVYVDMWGGGGGGGSANASFGGGGAGGMRIQTWVQVTPGNTYAIVVGAGGAGGIGASAQDGAAGVSSSFDTLTAPGGSGGLHSSGGGSGGGGVISVTGGFSASGGSGQSGGGSTVFASGGAGSASTGGGGGAGWTSAGSGGGGGGAGGTTSSGGNGFGANSGSAGGGGGGAGVTNGGGGQAGMVTVYWAGLP